MKQSEFIEWLKNNNFTMVGKGGYSSVWQHSDTPNCVLKIGQDPAYVKYAKIALKKDNHFLPKIISFNDGKDDGNDFFTIVLEKLNPADKKLARDFLDRIILGLKNNKKIELTFAEKDLVNILANLKHKYMLDMAVKNVMARDDGSLVLIDPVH